MVAMPRALIQLTQVASPRKIEGGTAIEGTLDADGSFLTVKNLQGETIGTFRSSAVVGWWPEADQVDDGQTDLAARLEAAEARLAKGNSVTDRRAE